MLPDFTKARAEMGVCLNDFLKDRMKFHNPAFKDVPVRIIHEGTGTTMINKENNFEHETDMKPVEAFATVSHDELIADPSQIYRMLDELAKQMAEQQSRIMVDTVSDITEQTGQVLKRKGTVEPDDILAMFDKMLIAFNDYGIADLPVIHAGPHMIPEIKAALRQFETNMEYKKQFDELILRKKREWYDRENNRKLVG
jgi:hypothetical protein